MVAHSSSMKPDRRRKEKERNKFLPLSIPLFPVLPPFFPWRKNNQIFWDKRRKGEKMEERKKKKKGKERSKNF
jgi:hypothetical protein